MMTWLDQIFVFSWSQQKILSIPSPLTQNLEALVLWSKIRLIQNSKVISLVGLYQFFNPSPWFRDIDIPLSGFTIFPFIFR